MPLHVPLFDGISTTDLTLRIRRRDYLSCLFLATGSYRGLRSGFGFQKSGEQGIELLFIYLGAHIRLFAASNCTIPDAVILMILATE